MGIHLRAVWQYKGHQHMTRLTPVNIHLRDMIPAPGMKVRSKVVTEDFLVQIKAEVVTKDGGLVLTKIHRTSNRTLEDMVILPADLVLILVQANLGQAKACLAVELTSR